MVELSDIFDIKGVLSLSVLIVLIFYTLLRGLSNKDQRAFWSPMTIISLTFLYYTVIGPLFAIYIKDTTYRYVELGQHISISWVGAAVTLLFINIGFLLKPIRVFRPHNIEISNVKKPALALFIFALLLYAYWMGSRFSSFFLILLANVEQATYEEMYGGNFDMYLMQSMAFFVSVCSLLFVVYLKRKSKINALLFFGIAIFTLIAYLISGFRFRIVMLFISLATVYYLVKNVRIKLLPWLIGGFVFVLAMGLIEQTRSYESGLNLEKTEGSSLFDYIESGTNETRIFLVSGAVIDLVSEKKSYVGFEPITTALLMPIPRSLFANKPYGSYYSDLSNYIFRGYAGGAAYMNYGEAYQAFGWIGIILNGLFIGYLAKLFFNYYKHNSNSIYAIVILALFNGFVYILVARGYLAQISTIFFFYVLIPMWLFLLFKKIMTKN